MGSFDRCRDWVATGYGSTVDITLRVMESVDRRHHARTL
jgi:hypothetical protein